MILLDTSAIPHDVDVERMFELIRQFGILPLDITRPGRHIRVYTGQGGRRRIIISLKNKCLIRRLRARVL